ncbi:MAG: hypothetical protein H6559_35615 [Lewinellaceae bacterium]|nr:hypothetical protein [Lewinellaceae bacterium]
MTVEFTSDFSIVAVSFELAWSCAAHWYLRRDVFRQSYLHQRYLPFNQDGFSSCDDAVPTSPGRPAATPLS